MFKIKDRIALLYSLLMIILISIFAILFYSLLKINIDKNPIMSSFEISNKQTKTAGIKKDNINSSIIISSEPVGIQDNREKNKNSEDDFLIILDKDNNLLRSEELSNNFSENAINKIYGTENAVLNPKDLSMKDLINKHDKGNLLIIEDKNNKVLRYQILSDNLSTYGSDTSSNSVQFTWDNFQKTLMSAFYKRFIFVILMVILIIALINFILSKKYAAFALKPLSNFTKEVKNQKDIRNIELIEPPKIKDEIYDLTIAYNEALEKIRISYEDLQRLNSYASHELRNSLAVLRAKIELGEDSNGITSYIDRLTGIINDILAMSTTHLSGGEEFIDIALICAKIVDEYTNVFSNIKLFIPEEGIELVKGKEVWVERCIVNLIDNSIKFMDKDKINNEINITISQDNKNVIVEVYDNGIGVDKNNFSKIFDAYYGTNNRTSTGIGLAYIKHIMDLHKGRVLVESRKGEYSKFSLLFPKNE
jgi:signal transduction histidine kinase